MITKDIENINNIVNIVSNYFNVTSNIITIKSKSNKISTIRGIIIYILHSLIKDSKLDMNINEIPIIFNDVIKLSTVKYQHNKVKDLLYIEDDTVTHAIEYYNDNTPYELSIGYDVMI